MTSLLGGKSKTQTNTQSNVVNLPGYIQGPLQGLIGRAEALTANETYPTYGGERLADLSPEEQRAFELVNNMIGTSPDQINQSNQITQEVARRGLEGFSQEELAPYMNPYIENVLDVGRRRQFENYDQTMADYRNRAGEAAAFGGSRFGLGEAQMSQDFQQQISDYDTQGLYDAYNQGLAGAVQGTQMAGQASIDNANLATTQQGARLQDIQALGSSGQAQRGHEQAGLDIGYEDFLNAQAFPYQQQNHLANILLPSGQLTAGNTTTNTQTTSGGGGSFLSKAIGIGSLIAAPFTGGASLGFAGAGGGLTSSIFGAGGIGNLTSQGPISYLASGANGAQGPLQGWGKFNKGGLVNVPQKHHYNKGGSIGGSVLSFLKYMNALEEEDEETALSELPKISRGGLEIVEEQETSPGGITDMEFRDLWEKIQNGEIAPPSPNDASPSLPQRGAGLPSKKTISESDGSYETASAADYFDVLADIESSNNPDAVNKHTQAAGLYQFLPSTAKAYGLKNPHDPIESRKAVGEFTQDNTKVLKKKLGRNPSLPEVYLAHQQGAGGASKLLANPDALAKDVVGKGAVIRNGGHEDMTAGEFAGMWLNKFQKAQKRLQKGVQNFNEGGLVKLLSDYHKKRIDPLSPQGPQLFESGPFDSFGERFLTGVKNIPSYPGVGLRKLADTLENAAETTGEFFTKPRIPAEQSTSPEAVTAANTPAKMRALYDAQNRLLEQHGLGAVQQKAPTPQAQKLVAPQQEDPATKIINQLQQASGTTSKTEAPKEKKQTRAEKAGVNMPLLMFGAALLESDGSTDFFQDLGRASKVAGATSMSLEDREKEYAQQQLENTLRQRAIDVQEGNLSLREQENPFQAQIAALKYQKLQKELGSDDELNKRRDKMAVTLIENMQAADLKEAYAMVDQVLIGSDGEVSEQGLADPLGLR